MNWLGKKRATLQLPFPRERLSALITMIVPAAVVSAVKLRQEPNLTIETVYNSQFFNSYVCAYATTLDENSPQLGAAVRFAMLRGLLAGQDSEAQLRFDTFKVLLEKHDAVTRLIWKIGAEDGERYFSALLNSEDADDSATANLRLAIRSEEDFRPFAIPASGL